ncbi:hypothetical protein C8R44DRAFT_325011 [Mycena epipterygia]|nr:hypothetical protein C8R44DRAFT_325011 [Mycena epipterygia]
MRKVPNAALPPPLLFLADSLARSLTRLTTQQSSLRSSARCSPYTFSGGPRCMGVARKCGSALREATASVADGHQGGGTICMGTCGWIALVEIRAASWRRGTAEDIQRDLGKVLPRCALYPYVEDALAPTEKGVPERPEMSFRNNFSLA